MNKEGLIKDMYAIISALKTEDITDRTLQNIFLNIGKIEDDIYFDKWIK